MRTQQQSAVLKGHLLSHKEKRLKAEIATLKTKNKDTLYFQVLKATKILMSTRNAVD